MTAKELAQTIIHDIYLSTGITATAGIGTNLYLSKVAMDILVKKQRRITESVLHSWMNCLTGNNYEATHR